MSLYARKDGTTPVSHYDVLVIGAGASGSALAYTLARYTDIRKIALVEKYSDAGNVNSKSSNNSQTLHVGDIETNYTIEKAAKVKNAAMMIPAYAGMLSKEERDTFLFPVQKMVLGVGHAEVEYLRNRFEELRQLFPDLRFLNKKGIAEVEPLVAKGRAEDIAALYSEAGYAVDFQALAQSFIRQTHKENRGVDVFYDTQILHIEKRPEGYRLTSRDGSVFTTDVLVVNADAYSLKFAKELGYGHEFSLIPIAGTFYFSDAKLRGKVYTIQDPSLPFAAVHGDPDVRVAHMTRWGPTARLLPVLESGNIRTMLDYFLSAGLFRTQTITSFIVILSEWKKLGFLLKNTLYEVPYLGTWLFAKNVRKIVPTISSKELHRAHGFGGMRLQRVDIRTNELQLGEGKIIGENSIFNMTPSPGASVALYNASEDTKRIVAFFDGKFTFDESKLKKELQVV